jgi:hypothetical protein
MAGIIRLYRVMHPAPVTDCGFTFFPRSEVLTRRYVDVDVLTRARVSPHWTGAPPPKRILSAVKIRACNKQYLKFMVKVLMKVCGTFTFLHFFVHSSC